MMKKSRLICAALVPVVVSVFAAHSFSQARRPAAEMKFREMRFRKPPLVELYFDLLLRNDRVQPRWFLLPSKLNPESTKFAGKGGVDGLKFLRRTAKGASSSVIFLARADSRRSCYPLTQKCVCERFRSPIGETCPIDFK
jgi:hypothetical protein